MKFKNPNPGVDECIVSRCRSLSAVELGAATTFVPIDEDVGACQAHWEQICEEQEAERERKAMVGATVQPKDIYVRNPVQKKRKRNPVPMKTS